MKQKNDAIVPIKLMSSINIIKKNNNEISKNEAKYIVNKEEINLKKTEFPFYKKKIGKTIFNDNKINLIYCHNENINLKKLNEEMIRKLELYEKENNDLQNLVTQLNQDLIYKDKCIEECEKIIKELKKNYINEYNKKEVQIKKNEDDILYQNIEKIKEMEKYRNENNKIKIELNRVKYDYNEAIKKLKILSEAYEKEQHKNNNYINMLKEREKEIEKGEMKIKNLEKEKNSKEEQINLLIKYKKDEKDNDENNNEKIYKNDFMINIFPLEETFNIDILENKILNNNKINFKLEQALKDILYIPPGRKKHLSKEYLIDMNFKTELIKIECFSNYIREFNLYQLINNNKIDFRIINDIITKIYFIESQYKEIVNENNIYSKENIKLRENIKELYLYIIKIREQLYNTNKNIKLKLNHLITLYEIKMKQKKSFSIPYTFEHINSIFLKSSNNIITYASKYNKKEEPFMNLTKIENERLKKEIAILIKDINEQQNEISNMKKIKYNFENLNKNLFSISDYMKYSLIYELNNTKEILNVFHIMINNTKNNNDNSFGEIIKNYLIVSEKIKTPKKINYEENLKEAFCIFKERYMSELNELNENDIFMRKLIIILFEISYFN